MPDVRARLHGRSADVEGDVRGVERDEVAQSLRFRVIQPNGHPPSLPAAPDHDPCRPRAAAPCARGADSRSKHPRTRCRGDPRDPPRRSVLPRRPRPRDRAPGGHVREHARRERARARCRRARRRRHRMWSAWIDGDLAGIGACKDLGADRAELKSMRVVDAFLGRGVGRRSSAASSTMRASGVSRASGSRRGAPTTSSPPAGST